MLTDIHKRVQEKGWAFYHMDENMPLGFALAVGPVDNLQPGRQYALFPYIPGANNPSYILKAYDDLYEQGVDIQVSLDGEEHPLAIVRFYQQHAVLPRFDDQPDIICSQQALYDGLHALESITDIKMPIYAF